MITRKITENAFEEVLKKLPSNVKVFVEDYCCRTIIPEKHGAGFLSEEQYQKPYMLIYYELGKKGWNIEHVIAHEIAHAHLGHRCDQQSPNDELAAEKQVTVWKLHTSQLGYP
ncbi:MAG: hypothetical protein ACYTE8_03010 [Planctomycetota bacterium]|jgi:hypothetical protein